MHLSTTEGIINKSTVWPLHCTHMCRRRYFTLVYRDNRSDIRHRQWARVDSKNRGLQTYDNRPTPKPAMIRPTTITQNPGVKVWTAPPTPKMTAPMKSVPRRPSRSPTCPAASEVTKRRHGYCRRQSIHTIRTEGAYLQDGDHGTDLDRAWTIEELAEVRACDDPRHDSVAASDCVERCSADILTLDHIRTGPRCQSCQRQKCIATHEKDTQTSKHGDGVQERLAD